MTIAGSENRKTGLTMTGVASHITAASKGGPRYDPSMSPDERSSESNGIWTCQIHGKFIDDNPSKVTVEELRRWKYQHEKWVFDRVESGAELFNDGVYRIGAYNVGVFSDEHTIPIGRHNILVGENDSGKTTVCQMLALFAGGNHWKKFNKRFKFNRSAKNHSCVEISHISPEGKTTVKISPQLTDRGRKRIKNTQQRIHVEVNGHVAVDWPRPLFRVLYFDMQLYRTNYRDPQDTFLKAIKYLATEFNISEDVIWDSMREELFATSTFGYKLRRRCHRRVDVLVPDGRDFYVSHKALSFTEQQMVFLEIALKLANCSPKKERWFIIFDSTFYSRLDLKYKDSLFRKIASAQELNIQTLFCLHSTEDAEALKNLRSEKWVNASHFGKLTLHNFL